MTHLTEEQLVLYYYGEEGDTLTAGQHLESCPECRSLYGSLQRVLNVVDTLPVPDRGPEYGSQLWARIAPAVGGTRPVSFFQRFLLPGPLRLAASAAALAVLLVAAFLAGRFSPRTQPHQPSQLAADPQAGERILLLAVGDYLERSQMVLIELANAPAKQPLDISSEQERAADLVDESRLYRQTAAHTGDAAVASVLDDLDRVLLEIAHAPSRLSPEELDKLHQRLEAEGILFKIRVLGSNVRNQEQPGSPAAQKL